MAANDLLRNQNEKDAPTNIEVKLKIHTKLTGYHSLLHRKERQKEKEEDENKQHQ